MRWKYWIHHTWPEERTGWAEAFVRPDDPTYAGQSLWVTIDCLGEPPDENPKSTLSERYEDLRTWLGDHPYRVTESGEMGDADLVVNALDFTKAEFLEWVKVWLRAKGLPATELVPALLEEFAGTHPHADLLAHLVQQYPISKEHEP